ncbi:MAG: PLP-dependent cysteine synthase family protein, partial [Anaerolineae bacterium]
MPSHSIIPGPTYSEMLDPTSLPAELRSRAAKALHENELDPVNLFNITWKTGQGKVNHILLPKQLTGVEANIVVLLGKDFPSGSHKVGPAYATLIEAEAGEEIRPGQVTIIGPSTGNFGIGTAYISRLKGYQAIVVMPDDMSKERYERIRKYGGKLDLTPGTESDVILTLERTHEVYMPNPQYKVLAQFELLPNYRFHRHVTGNSAIEVARGYGDGKMAAFVAAPGSAGTLGAGDQIKQVYAEAVVVAPEPRECSTLYNDGRGQHRIEGIGDKMVALIHNVLTTDYVLLVHDDDCVKGLKVLQDGTRVLVDRLGVPAREAERLRGLFGISSLCNIIGAIKAAKYLGLGPEENVVTVATDGFDRYPSVMVDLEERMGGISDDALEMWAKGIFRGATTTEILDVRGAEQKERLFCQKEQLWTRFGYSKEYLEAMKSPDFWEAEYEKIPETDERIRALRE